MHSLRGQQCGANVVVLPPHLAAMGINMVAVFSIPGLPRVAFAVKPDCHRVIHRVIHRGIACRVILPVRWVSARWKCWWGRNGIAILRGQRRCVAILCVAICCVASMTDTIRRYACRDAVPGLHWRHTRRSAKCVWLLPRGCTIARCAMRCSTASRCTMVPAHRCAPGVLGWCVGRCCPWWKLHYSPLHWVMH